MTCFRFPPHLWAELHSRESRTINGQWSRIPPSLEIPILQSAPINVSLQSNGRKTKTFICSYAVFIFELLACVWIIFYTYELHQPENRIPMT